MKKTQQLLRSESSLAILGFFLVIHLPIVAVAQQAEDQDPAENSGGVIQRYGRNAAINLDSILALNNNKDFVCLEEITISNDFQYKTSKYPIRQI